MFPGLRIGNMKGQDINSLCSTEGVLCLLNNGLIMVVMEGLPFLIQEEIIADCFNHVCDCFFFRWPILDVLTGAEYSFKYFFAELISHVSVRITATLSLCLSLARQVLVID